MITWAAEGFTTMVVALSVTGEETFPDASVAQTLMVYAVPELRLLAIYEVEETAVPLLQLEAEDPCAMATK
jgi:hypothetical protein